MKSTKKNDENDNPRLPWHALSTEEVATFLEVDTLKGLSDAEALARLEQYGPNSLPETKRKPHIAIFLHQFRSPLIYLLLAAAGAAFFLGEGQDASVILVVVLLNAVIGAFQEGRAARSLDSLRRLATMKVRALRGGHEVMIEARLVVPGDLLLLAPGDGVAADARLIEAKAVESSEAALTGESLPVAKDTVRCSQELQLTDRRNMLYAGTHVTAGRAKAIVVTTGLGTELGHIAKLTTTAIEPKTPLERRIHQFGMYLVAVSVVLFFLIIGIGMLRGLSFNQIFMIAISQMVSIVPEGLPVAMTIALAVGVQRMARRGAIVRRLSAVETLGATSVICSDKTGTLTRNEMTVTSIFLARGERIQVTGAGYAPEGKFLAADREIEINGDKDLLSLLTASVLCNDANLTRPDSTDNRWRAIGDPTEAALLTLALKSGMSLESTRRESPRKAELPFDSAVKMMATQHHRQEGALVFIKGAPEFVLDLCGFYQSHGDSLPIDADRRRVIRDEAEQMAAQALRLLAFAVVNGVSIDGRPGFAAFRGQAVFIGLVGQLDPPRTEAHEAVSKCLAAGIRPMMVTGDHKVTGMAVAKILGIYRDGDLAYDGTDLEKLSEEELGQKIGQVSVFARVHPSQKLRIVEALQKSGKVVAMTGDGVNDAPALARADVGVAMGITGTEVAKEAAKIVITDDNFATIVAAVEEGRLVYGNLKKVILFLFTTSTSAVVILLAALIAGYPLPFAAVQILWNNLIIEGAVTINLILEPLEGDEMQRRPISSSEPLLTRSLLMRMSIMTPTIVTVTFGWFAVRVAQGVPFPLLQSETLTMLVCCEWFNVLNCRSDKDSALSFGLFKNQWLVGGLTVSVLLQLAVIYWAPLNRLFHTTPIAATELFAIGAAASLVLWVEELRKLVVRSRTRRLSTGAHSLPVIQR